jgi:multicomponent Na+:H+ antiporter subunit B
MSIRIRTWFYVIFAVMGFGILLYAATGLPEFGSFGGAYSDYILRLATFERHIVNAATAVNFDYRGFDTMGEEFIFFTSVTGVLFMLSSVEGKAAEHAEPMEGPGPRQHTGALRWFPIGLAGFLAAMSMNVAAHTTVTPGGGFQGGAIFGSAVACVYLGLGFQAFEAVARREIYDALKSFGAACYVFLGLATMFSAGSFLQNALWTGQKGAIVSGGLVYLINAAVFIEIGCGFGVLMFVFVRQMRQREEPV